MSPERLSSLIDQVVDATYGPPNSREDWQELRALIKRARASFKGIQFVTREDHSSEWDRLNTAATRLREIEQEQFEARQQFRKQSENHLDEIMSEVEAAKPDDGWLIETFLTLFTGGLSKIVLDAFWGDLERAKYELQQRSSHHRAARAYLRENHNEMLGRHRHEARMAIDAVKEQLDSDWADFKGKRQEYFDRKSEAKAEAAERNREWRERTEGHRDRFIEIRGNKEDKLDKLIANRSKLEDMRYNAKGDDFRSQVDDWIDENERKISDTESDIESLTDKIRDIEGKLRG